MKIVAEKYYLNWRGDRVGPMRRLPYSVNHYVEGDSNGVVYLESGSVLGGDDPDDRDLISELAQPSHGNAMPPQQKPDSTAYCVTIDPSYGHLGDILQSAHDQAAHGKGKDRHANGRPFDRQPIMEISRMFGPGFAAGQATKKAQEAMGMLNRQERDAAIRELLGAINYIAACVMLIRESQNESNTGTHVNT